MFFKFFLNVSNLKRFEIENSKIKIVITGQISDEDNNVSRSFDFHGELTVLDALYQVRLITCNMNHRYVTFPSFV